MYISDLTKNLFRLKWLNSCSAIVDGQCPHQGHFMGQNSTPRDTNQKYVNATWNLVNANMAKNVNLLMENMNWELLTNIRNSRQFHARLSTNQVQFRIAFLIRNSATLSKVTNFLEIVHRPFLIEYRQLSPGGFIKWGASSWWSFRPTSTRDSIETTIIRKTYPTLPSAQNTADLIVSPWQKYIFLT